MNILLTINKCFRNPLRIKPTKKMKESEAELFNSKCPRDYKNRHYWVSIGVIGIRPIYQVFKCSQCERIVTEELIPLKKGIPS